MLIDRFLSLCGTASEDFSSIFLSKKLQELIIANRIAPCISSYVLSVGNELNEIVKQTYRILTTDLQTNGIPRPRLHHFILFSEKGDTNAKQ